MQVKAIEPKQLTQIRPLLLEFVHQHGDERITHEGIRWLIDLSGAELEKNGNCIIIATERRTIAGLLAVSNYGIHQSFIVVHHDYRQKGTAKELMKDLLSRMNPFYARVSYDNIPSLSTCFSMGMIAFKVVKGPTGKPTFILKYGT